MAGKIAIVSAARTAMGGFQGDLQEVPAPELGATAIKAVIDRAGIDRNTVDEVLMGCVLPAGQGQAPARQAALGAGLPLSTGCTTVNKMCGSGMQTAIMAHDILKAGSRDVMIAGGMESMSRAPYILPNMRRGARIGHDQVKDHMFLDGLEDAYEPGRLMGSFAEEAAEKWQLSREAQDAYAIESLHRANTAIEEDKFTAEITPHTVTTRQGPHAIDTDEQPGKAKPDKIPALRPAFKKDGTVTAANASSISDGAAALLMMREETARANNIDILATIEGHAFHAQKPKWFTSAPVPAMEKALAKAGWAIADVDLFEINEAFAVVPMIAMQELGIPHHKVNVHGGACALGHPIGASGARIMVTLIHALQDRGLKRGLASLCIGGGEATAMAIELA